jgi:hypothetical protein
LRSNEKPARTFPHHALKTNQLSGICGDSRASRLDDGVEQRFCCDGRCLLQKLQHTQALGTADANQRLFSGLFRMAEASLHAHFDDRFNRHRVFSTSLAGSHSVQLRQSRSI